MLLDAAVLALVTFIKTQELESQFKIALTE